MDTIVTQIHALAKAADEAGRLNIIKALRQVQVELQSPKDSLMEIAGSVCIISCPSVGCTDSSRAWSMQCFALVPT